VAPLHRHLFDGFGHAGRGNRDGPRCHLFGAVGEAGGRLQASRQCRQGCSGGFPDEGAVPLGPKDLGEELRLQAAQHHVGVGEGGWTAATVGGRSGSGAGGGRPHPQPLPIAMDHRPAAGGQCMDGDHGHHQGAVARQGDQVGEGAAPIHPETPAGL